MSKRGWFTSSDEPDKNKQVYSNAKVQCPICGVTVKTLQDGSLPRHKDVDPEDENKWSWCYG